ncbi:three-Cys-motif partner protein TcmP [Altererythrobacter sp. KTW20L]|uniref:three-Cys-motif partner protein TcmP n=1 Tax=Altererythrobacter sp. KTW20L TaxID=2942210 RepID=UPI0020C00B57|nr:three-Cys-motif partner protein TcmP [Altererythrobacter sp. KTW20L]
MIELEVPPHYAGREQAYVKHHFLREYLERLAFKIASAFDELVYVDGYSGPWKSGDENYGDTSFGIALERLTAARETWRDMPSRRRDVRMTAHLVEEKAGPFRELEGIGARFPEVSVKPHRGDFLKLAPSIASAIPQRAFTFSLIDPKGFTLDLDALKPLLARPRSEVVFNFMYEFANRFVEHPDLADTFDRLLPGVDWRPRFASLTADPASGPDERKAFLLSCFKEAVKAIGGFKYVADIEIRHPGKNRTYYFLVYATREPHGLEVFRDCQVKALAAQAQIAGQKSQAKRETNGQTSLFGTEWESAGINHRQFLDEQRNAARLLLLEIAATEPGIRWGEVWPRMLADYAIRKTDAGAIAGTLRKEAMVSFPGWGGKKRIPSDDYRLQLT